MRDLSGYVAWFKANRHRLPADQRAVGDFVVRHEGALALRLRRGRWKNREDELQGLMLGVVEAVREAQLLGVSLDGPLGDAFVERALLRSGAAVQRVRRGQKEWSRRAVLCAENEPDAQWDVAA